MNLRPVERPSLGIDIGGTKTRAVVLDPQRRVLAERLRRTETGEAGVVATALAAAEDCLQLAGLAASELDAVGVGIPGRVDHRTGVVSTAVNLGIVRLELGATLSAALHVAVHVENDVKATALGAADYLGTAGSDLTYLNIGTGVASATLLGGRLVRGQGNLAGEIGHVPVDPSAGRCACGQVGCLEVLAGGGQIVRRLEASGSSLTLRSLLGAAESGDRFAAAESLRLAGGLATAVQLVVAAFGSPRVALGGGVLNTAPGLFELTGRLLTERAAHSDFLASMELPARIALLPAAHPLAAIGAALAGHTSLAPSPWGRPARMEAAPHERQP